MSEQIQEISQPTQPVQPVPVEPKKKPSFKITVILLIVILLLAGGVYAGMQFEKRKAKVWTEPPLTEITPQPIEIPNETANWKTYANTKYGFQFKYLPEMTINEGNLSESNSIVELNGQNGKSIEILYFNNSNKLTLEEFVKERNSEPDRGQDFFVHPELAEKKEFNGMTVYYERDTVCEPLFCTLVSIPYEDKIFAIIYKAKKYQEAPATEEELKFLDQILSTLKFSDQTSVDATSQWKTYTDISYSFSFRYPNNFVYELNDFEGISEISVMEKDKLRFQIKGMRNYSAGQKDYLLDTSSNGQKTIGNMIWKTYSLPNGYSDMAGGTRPIYGLQVEYKNALYSIYFYDQSLENEFSNQILSTFKFTD